MKKYAVLNENNKVINLIVASSLEIAEKITSSLCVLITAGTTVEIGYVYEDGSFVVGPEELSPETRATLEAERQSNPI